MKTTIVWMAKHYNKFLHSWDYRLTCDDDRWPIQVFADDRPDAEGFCDHFLGKGNWELKETF